MLPVQEAAYVIRHILSSSRDSTSCCDRLFGALSDSRLSLPESKMVDWGCSTIMLLSRCIPQRARSNSCLCPRCESSVRLQIPNLRLERLHFPGGIVAGWSSVPPSQAGSKLGSPEGSSFIGPGAGSGKVQILCIGSCPKDDGLNRRCVSS